ncbi:hypothetical protein Nepgr_005480 [Nepenthes gracilis]|uniref:Uncharacterized protein n=1 Tax=Nepenthes gracilis TaxID=150966 RepID=A0AAD3S3D8_NEPGR|nr:hypothetical protein Nepgr_005480 [Nepenthes gracilis]
MANRSQDLRSPAQDPTAQAQEKRDGGVISQVANAASETAQQATQILQQTGVQVKNMALGAADAVRNTLGMSESNPTTTVNTTSSNTNAANSPATAGGAANPTTTTPGGANRLDLK